MRSILPTGDHHRGKPGRPRNVQPRPESGHNMGTVEAGRLMNGGGKEDTLVGRTSAPIVPRLLDLHGTASYLSLSEWTVRDLEACGILPRVRVPLPNQGKLRKILFDKEDLDRLIEAWKEEI